jgi:tetratricopeptide (TPR) repeat protein
LLNPQSALPAGDPGALPAAPRLGLIGRATERAELLALFSAGENAPVWITGYEGMGKTALLVAIARDLLESGAFEQVVYTSLGKSGVPEAALYDLSHCLLAGKLKLTEDTLPALEKALQETRTLIVWDDAGAILYGGAQALDQQAMIQWYQMANRIAASAPSMLCVLSDGPELPPSARRLARVRNYHVGPLQAAEATQLGLALDRQAGRPEAAPTWEELVAWFGGNPLALACTSAATGAASLQEMADRLVTRAPGLRSGDGQYRNRGLDMAMDALVANLQEPLKSHLPDLGVMVGGFVENLGPEIIGITREEWVAQSGPLKQAGLVWDEPVPVLTIPMVRMHPALQRWALQRLTASRRSELDTEHYSHAFGLMSWIFKSAGTLQAEGPALFYRDLGNQRRGADEILASGDIPAAISYLQVYNALLGELGLKGESDRATAAVGAAAQALLPAEGPWTRQGVSVALQQAEALMTAGQVQQAGNLLSQLAVRFERPDGVDYKGTEASLDRVRVLRDLSQVLRSSGHADVALRSLTQALELLDPFDATAPTRMLRADILGRTVDVHQQLGQLEEAERACQRALGALEGLDEPALKADLYMRTSAIALRRNNAEGARDALNRAHEIRTASGDLEGLAAIENQLAAIAMRTPQEAPQALTHLTRAIEYARQGDQWLVEGQLLAQRASVASQLAQPAACEADLTAAITLYQEHGAAGLLAITHASYAEFLLQQERLEEARSAAERALEIAMSGTQGVPWEIYYLLQRVASARKDTEELTRWRLQTRQSYTRSTAAAAVITRFRPLIEALVQAAGGEALDTDVADMLEALERTPQGKELARSLWQILSGERGEVLFESVDHIGAAVVEELLRRLESHAEPESESEE